MEPPAPPPEAAAATPPAPPPQPLAAVCARLLDPSSEDERVAALRALPDEFASDADAHTVLSVGLAMLAPEPVLRLDDRVSEYRLYGPRVDAFPVLLRVLPCASAAAALVADDRLWAGLHAMLRAPDGSRGARKAACALLQRSLATVRAAETADGSVARAPPDVAALAAEQWAAFVTLLDALEDMPTYLLVDIWRRVGVLFEAVGPLGREGALDASSDDGGRDDGCAAALPARVPRPSFTRPVPFVWTSILLDRAFSHENPGMVRDLLSQVMDTRSLGAAADAATDTDGGATAAPDDDNDGANNYADGDGDGGAPSAPPFSGVTAGPDGKRGDGGGTQLAPLRVRGQPLGLLLPPWYVCGTDATVAVAADGDSMTVRLPCLLAHLGDAGLYRGAEEAFGMRLAAYASGYLEALARASPGAVPGCVRQLLDSSRLLATAGGGVRRFYSALAAVNPAAFATFAGDGATSPALLPHALDPTALAVLRAVLSVTSALQSRTFTAERARDLAGLLMAWCDPAAVGLCAQPVLPAGDPAAARLPLPDLLHMLATFSSSTWVHVTRSRGSSLGVSQWLLRLADPAAGGDSDSERLHALSEPLARVVDAYVNAHNPAAVAATQPLLAGATLPLTAAGIARLLALLPWSPAADGALDAVLAPLLDALTCVRSHAYMPPPRRARALMLLQALLAASAPRSRAADAHLSRHVVNDAVPEYHAELPHPLCAEYAAAARACTVSAAADEWAAQFGVAAAPDEDYDEGSESAADGILVTAGHVRRRLGAALVAVPSVAADVSSFLEAAIAPGICVAAPLADSLAAASLQLLWAPDVQPWSPAVDDDRNGTAAPSVVLPSGVPLAPSPPPALTVTFHLTLLRQCIDSASAADGGCDAYAAAGDRLLASALAVLKAAAAGGASSSRGSDYTATAAALVAQTNALQIVAAVCGRLLTGTPYSRSNGGSNPDEPRLLAEELAQTVVSLTFRRPRGVEYALPLYASAAGEGDVASSANGGGGDHVRISWLSLLSLHESCRWSVLATLLRAASARFLRSVRRRSPAVATATDHAPVTLLGLPPPLCDALAEAALDALDSATPEYEHAVIQAVGYLLPCCKAKGETDEAYTGAVATALAIAGTDGDGSATAEPSVAPLSSVTLDAFLAQLMSTVRERKVARRPFVVYAAGALQPLMFLRPALHLVPGQQPGAVEDGDAPSSDAAVSSGLLFKKRLNQNVANRKGDAGDAAAGGGAGPLLRRHILSQLDFFMEDTRPAWAVQVLAASLVRAWRALLRVAGRASSGGTATAEAAAVARSVLLSYAPVMMTLLLHRELMQAWEGHALTDSTARAQLGRWMARWEAHLRAQEAAAAGAAAPRRRWGGWWQQGTVDLLGAELAAAGSDDEASGGAAQPSPDTAANFLGVGGAGTSFLSERGAAAVARVQVLVFLDELCDVATAERTSALLAAAAPCADVGPACALQRILMLRLACLNRSELWRVDCMPGSPAHGAKLRSWQALTLLAARFGEVDRDRVAAATASDALPVPGTQAPGACPYGPMAYLPAADCYLPTSGHCRTPAVAPHLRPRPSVAPAAAPAAQQQRSGGVAQRERAADGVPTPAELAALPSLSEAQLVEDVAAVLAADALTVIQLPSTRYYTEATLVALSRRFPSVVGARFVVPTLRDPGIKSQHAVSTMFVTYDLLARTTALAAAAAASGASGSAPAAPLLPPWAADQLRVLSAAVFFGVLQWLITPVGLVRTLSLGILLEATPRLFPATAPYLDPATAPALRPPVPAGFRLPADGDGDGAAAAAGDDSSLPPSLALVLPQLYQVAISAELQKMVRRQAAHLRRLDPRRAATLRSLLTSPSNEHGELVPVDVYTRVKAAFTAGSVALHTAEPYGVFEAEWLGPQVEWAVGAGLLPRAAYGDQRLREGVLRVEDAATVRAERRLAARPESSAAAAEYNYVSGSSGGSGSGSGVDAPSPVAGGAAAAPGTFNFQRKLLSAAAVTTAATAAADVDAAASALAAADPALAPAAAAVAAAAPAGSQLLLPTLAAAAASVAGVGSASPTGDDDDDGALPSSSHAAVAALRSLRHPVLTQLSADGRPCQPLVVVASLVDKVPNLAGLARTCEIMAAESLVVPDGRVVADPVFRDVSVTASSWMSVRECRPQPRHRLVELLRQRRAQGYTIVGLEQAARSVALGRVTLPDRMVLVLGAEREGLPVELLAELDVVVEIPQLGLIRSLNVHVSGALLVWEYTRQRLARAAAARALQ